LAGFRFSTSPSISGLFEIIAINNNVVQHSGFRSFTVNRGWNFIFSISGDNPEGFEDPLSCSAIRCTIATAATISGTRKCSEKNRFKVGWETEKFPHSHSTSSFPRIGIAENRLVITVAPQKDICPHGSTYPRKAAAIVRRSRTIPLIHTMGFFWGTKSKFLVRCG